jgi:hypothetical protein
MKSHDLEVSMEAAAVLLSLAMRDTEMPATTLGSALGRMSASLIEWRDEKLANGKDGASAEDDAALRNRLERELAVCIESLQFHDRLIQQLAAVRNLLASVASNGPLNLTGSGAQRWEETLRMLRERLSEDSQHQLFNLLLRTGAVDGDGRRGTASQEGSIELF